MQHAASSSVHFYEFVAVAHNVKVAHELLLAYNDCRMVVVRVETQGMFVPEVGIKEQMYMVLGVIYQAERGYRAG